MTTSTTDKNRFRTLFLPGLAAAALAISACGSDSEGADSSNAGDGAEGITVEGAWARTSPMAATAGASYMTITAANGDTLVGASVDSSIAGTIEIHETTMVNPDDMEDGDSMSMDDGEMEDGDSMDMEDGEMEDGDHSGDMGVMQMREVGSIELPAGEAIALEPGGLHVMLLDLPEPLETGSTFDLTLDFETAPDMVVSVEVRDEAPGA